MLNKLPVPISNTIELNVWLITYKLSKHICSNNHGSNRKFSDQVWKALSERIYTIVGDVQARMQNSKYNFAILWAVSETLYCYGLLVCLLRLSKYVSVTSGFNTRTIRHRKYIVGQSNDQREWLPSGHYSGLVSSIYKKPLRV